MSSKYKTVPVRSTRMNFDMKKLISLEGYMNTYTSLFRSPMFHPTKSQLSRRETLPSFIPRYDPSNNSCIFEFFSSLNLIKVVIPDILYMENLFGTSKKKLRFIYNRNLKVPMLPKYKVNHFKSFYELFYLVMDLHPTMV